MGAWQTVPATIILAINTTFAPSPAPVASAKPAPAPSALPAAAEATLKEIGGVRVTTDLCKPLLTSAGQAVDYMLDDNLKLGQAIARMRNIDLDSSLLARSHGAHDLMQRFVSMRQSAVAGKAAIAKFREDAKAVKDPDQRAALLAFADAVDGALERQRKMAYDISRLAIFVDVHPPLNADDLAETEIALQQQMSYRYSPPGTLGYPYNIPQTLSQVSADSADTLQERAQPMFGDENAAATRIQPAFSGC